MAESAGARIVVGVAIIALVVFLAFVLEQVAGTDEASPAASASDDTPSQLQFCAAWETLASSASAEDNATVV